MAVSTADKHQQHQHCGSSAAAADKGGGLATPAVLSPTVKKWARWTLLALAACTVATLVFTTVARPQTIGEALAQIRSRPSMWGPVFFVANVVGVAAAAPYAIFQILAGAAFSLPLGYTLAWLGTSAGQCLAFLLGRYLFKDSLESYCMKRVPNFAAIESAIFKDGWKLLVLLKVAPMFPDCVLNYMLSLTSVDFSLFAVVSTVCLAPYTIMYVYIGHVSTNITDTISGRGRSGADGEEDDPRSRRVQIVAAVLSVLAAVMLMVYMVVVVKRALDSALSAQQANARRALSDSDDEDDDTRALLAAEEGLEGDSDTDRDTERPDQQALLLLQGGAQHGGRLQQGPS